MILAQHKANTRQIPLLYFLIVVNAWSLVATSFDAAPAYLTFHVPALLSAIALLRMVTWWRSRKDEPDGKLALKRLQRTNRVAAVLGVCFSIWGISLFSYGDAYGQGHAAFFIGVTVVGCIFCLSHVRSAALSVTIIANLSFLVLIVLSGNPVFAFKGLNVLLVSCAMLAIIWANFADFESLIVSKKVLTIQQQALEQRQKETQKLSDENFRLANLDSLTDLPNRRSFFARLEKCLEHIAGKDEALAIGILDLDGFKAVNDYYGHAVGDRLLVDVAARLRSVVNDNVFLSRLGGDEFGILITNESCDSALQALGDKICHVLQEPFKHQDADLNIGGSLGLSRCPPTGASSSQLYELADYALFQAKKTDRGHALVFSAEHQAEISRQRLIERGFDEPAFIDQVSVVFQPVVDVNTNRCIAFEALARWDHPLLGRVAPDQFIGIAERCGFIDTLTEILFDKALKQAVQWPEQIRLSFNLSAKNIASLQYAGRLASQIRKSGFDPHRIDFEITETAMIYDFAQVHAVLSTLKEIGVRISLDDFGTGFSSLKHLHSFPLDKIKIDRSFVTNIHAGSPGYGIVKSLLNLSQEMGIGCIVEGVETAEELEVVKSLGGLHVQGYYYSRPLPDDEVAAFLQHRDEPAAMAS
ncbi:putative bifunctional diguanylate cyclase/phosphodiesterase [Roseibium sp.]|uniref:putative bifunctional diguanylate cyclase/phosphodiesterase n=1 Tax=Roseibium sp. TaxID=1936156 RepID=UPI003A9859FE